MTITRGEQLLATTIRAGADRIYAVPGYPISPLVSASGARLVINEKVALELALGDSLAGRRACVIVKHVGMNALLDPLVHATFQGIIGGVVLVCGDDPTAKNTMTVQDSRYFGPVAGIPVLEGITESKIREAFAVSEQYSRVALLRVTADQLASPMSAHDGASGKETPGSMSQGSLAKPDLTMYGRAVRAAAEFPHLSSSGLAPLPLPLFPSASVPVSRQERGNTLGLCLTCQFRPLFEMMSQKGMTAICDNRMQSDCHESSVLLRDLPAMEWGLQ